MIVFRRTKRQENKQYFENIKYAKYLVILVVNIFFISCIIKATYFDLQSDTNGIFSLIMLILLILYNLYVLFVTYILIGRILLINMKYKQIILTILCAIPLFLIIYGYVSFFLKN